MVLVKEINIKNRTYNFFDNMINIKHFHSNLLKLDEKLYDDIHIHYIGYITIKDSDYVKINSINPLYMTIHKVNGYIEENNFWGTLSLN